MTVTSSVNVAMYVLWNVKLFELGEIPMQMWRPYIATVYSKSMKGYLMGESVNLHKVTIRGQRGGGQYLFGI